MQPTRSTEGFPPYGAPQQDVTARLSRRQLEFLQQQNLEAAEQAQCAVQAALQLQQQTMAAFQRWEDERRTSRSPRSGTGSPILQDLPVFGARRPEFTAEEVARPLIGDLGMFGTAIPAARIPGTASRGGELGIGYGHGPPGLVSRGDEQVSVIGMREMGTGTPGLINRGGEPTLTVQQQQQQQFGTIGQVGTPGLVSRGAEPMLQVWEQGTAPLAVGPPGLASRGGERVFGKGVDWGTSWGPGPTVPPVRRDAAGSASGERQGLWAQPEQPDQAWGAGVDAGQPAGAAGQPAQPAAYPPMFATPPPPPPPRPAHSEWAASVARANQLIAAAAALGQNLTLAEALSIAQARESSEQAAALVATAWRPQPVRAQPPARSAQDRLNSVEKSLVSFDGSGNVYDFIYKVESKLTQQNVVDEYERHALLSAKLTGKAFTAMRNNAAACSTFDGTVEFLREMYGPSVAGVRAQLLALKFHPNSESARQFNERFNAIAGTAPAGSVSMADLKSTYLQALGRGDQLLMKDAIWYGDTEVMTLSGIQRTLVSKLDNFSILSSTTLAGGPSALSAAYKPVSYDDNISVGGSEAATASSSIAELMKAVQAAKITTLPPSRPYMPPAAAAPATAPVAAAASPAPARAWTETRTCHICKKVGHLANNCPSKTERRNQMVNKAVGLVLDHLDRENQAAEAAQDAPAVPFQAAGCTMPGFAAGTAVVPAQAVHALKDWQQTTTPEQQGVVASSFATALATYCFANPADERATLYMQKVQGLGEAALQEMVQDGETGLVNRILAERRRTVGTQAGERGVAEDLWPGITDTLGALPAKTNVFEWLKESQKFCVSVIELAMEIAMDNGWRIDYARMEDEMVRARGSRQFGQYAADQRAKARLHGAEGGRIVAGRAAAQAAAKPTRWDVPPEAMQQDAQPDAQYVVGTTTPQELVAAAYSFEAARANAQKDFGVVEDLTSLSGPPTPHLIVQVVLCFSGRAVKVTAIRDTGSPDTIMTQGLYKHIGMSGGTRTERTFTGLGAQPSAFVGVCGALEVRLTPKITVSNPCYISPDTYCLFILGNDIFNKERVETLTQNDQTGVFLLRYGNTVDVLPYQLMSAEERQRRETAFAKQSPAESPALLSAYERNARQQLEAVSSTELLIATRAATAAISVDPAPVPAQVHLAVSDFPRLDAIEEFGEEADDDRAAYEAAAAAVEDSFLEF